MKLWTVPATMLGLLLLTPVPSAAQSSTTVVTTTVPAPSTTRIRRGAPAGGRDLEGMPVGIPGFGIPGPVYQGEKDGEGKPPPKSE